MGIVFRQSILSSAITLIGAGLGVLTILARTHLLSEVELGLLTNIVSAGTIMQLVVAAGSVTMMQTFIQRYPVGDPRRGTLLSVTVMVPLGFNLLFTIVYLVLKPQVLARYQTNAGLVSAYYIWLPVLSLLWSYSTYLEGFLVSHYKSAEAAFMREILLKLGFILLSVLLYYNLISSKIFIIGTVLCFSLQLIGSLALALRTPGFTFRFTKGAFTIDEYREMIRFSWYHLLAGASLYFIGYIDVVLLGVLFNLEAAGFYGIAVFIVNICLIPCRALIAAAYPKLNETYLQRNTPLLQQLYNRTTLNILIVTVGMILLVGLNMGNADIIIPAKFHGLTPVVLVLLLGRFIEAGTGPNAEVIGISKYYKFVFRISLVLVAALPIMMWLLVPAYGTIGAAWAVTITMFVFNIGKFTFAWKNLQLQPLHKSNLVVVLAGLATAVLVYFVPRWLPALGDLVFRSLLITVLYGGLLVWLKPSEDLQLFLQSVRKKF